MKLKILLSLVLILIVGCKQQTLKDSIYSTTSGSKGAVASSVSVSAKIRIVDQSNSAVSGATVTGNWSGVIVGSSSGVTDSNGYAILISNKSSQSGLFTLSISNVSKAGSTYDSSKNVVSSNSIQH